VDRAVFARRSIVVLLTGFAAFGLILASLGIFSVISYSVSRRKAEIGLRIALGASAGGLQAQILMQTLKLAAIGLAREFRPRGLPPSRFGDFSLTRVPTTGRPSPACSVCSPVWPRWQATFLRGGHRG
jgi:hypothetical protein